MDKLELWELPILFDTRDEEEIERYNSLNIPIDETQFTQPGFIYVNPRQIDSINEATDGNTTIETAGYRWLVLIPFSKFIGRCEIVKFLD